MTEPATSAFPFSTKEKRDIIDEAIHNERDFQDSRFPNSNPSVTGHPEVDPNYEERLLLMLGAFFGNSCRQLLQRVEGTPHVTNVLRLAILGEELGEVCEALLDGDSLETGRELLQTVTVGYAWLEALSIPELTELTEFRKPKLVHEGEES